MSFRVVLADDEPLALRRLEIALETIGGFDIIGKAGDGDTAKTMIQNLQPELILLDIKMPGLTGLELVEALDLPAMPAVIFVTAFDQFAVKAFDEGAVDYLLKPIGEERLAKAIERAKKSLLTRDSDERLADLLRTVAALKEDQVISETNSFEAELWISRSGQTVRVAIEDVSWFEAAGDYVQVHLQAETLLLYDSLRGLAERLDPTRFMRVHRSAIVSLQKVRAMERGRYGGLKIEMASGHFVSCSRSHSAAFRAAIGRD